MPALVLYWNANVVDLERWAPSLREAAARDTPVAASKNPGVRALADPWRAGARDRGRAA